MGQHQQPAGVGHGSGEAVGLGQVLGQRFLTDDVDAVGEELLRDREVGVGWGRDDDGVDAVLADSLGPGHLAVVEMDTGRIHQVGAAGGVGDVGVDRHGTRDEFAQSVDAEGDAVGVADDGVEAAADHTEADAATERLDQAGGTSAHDAVPIRLVVPGVGPAEGAEPTPSMRVTGRW
ncbi:MAG: hypothetical protein JWR85_1566 [Marmoricola sp.]|nr:hypothetical protein [Marmoricola sp.]